MSIPRKRGLQSPGPGPSAIVYLALICAWASTGKATPNPHAFAGWLVLGVAVVDGALLRAAGLADGLISIGVRRRHELGALVDHHGLVQGLGNIERLGVSLVADPACGA